MSDNEEDTTVDAPEEDKGSSSKDKKRFEVKKVGFEFLCVSMCVETECTANPDTVEGF